jgi:acetoin utilization deacetylase AcuC-like enzyme
VNRVAVVDCDVHQGNGTAEILDGDATTFTLSLHGAANFPFDKHDGDLDRPLKDGTADAEYLACLDASLDLLARRFQPDLLIYLAGADPHESDRLGVCRIWAAAHFTATRVPKELARNPWILRAHRNE